MDTKITISLRGLLVAGALILALAAAYVLGSAGHLAAPARAADQPASSSDRRVLTMTGEGTATAVPDQVSFRLTATAKRLDLDAALAEASRLMKHSLAALHGYGVAAADMQTTGLQMFPEYDYHSYGPPTLSGYRVIQTARVTVKQLDKAGKAISAVVTAGGNGVRVTGIQLEVGDPDAVLAQARAKAVQEATAKARQYATATGQSLGQVIDLREVSAAAPVPQPLFYGRALTDMAVAARPVPIRAGSDDLKVRVQIVWQFS